VPDTDGGRGGKVMSGNDEKRPGESWVDNLTRRAKNDGIDIIPPDALDWASRLEEDSEEVYAAFLELMQECMPPLDDNGCSEPVIVQPSPVDPPRPTG
jgi:hypothetical protein